MQNYRQSAHATYDLKYHLVLITKYRKKVLGGQIGERVRDLIRQVCKIKEDSRATILIFLTKTICFELLINLFC